MSELRYLSRLARPGSILEWDGKKIVPSETVVSSGSGVIISGSVGVNGDVSASHFSGAFHGRHTAQDSHPLITPGRGIDVAEMPNGSFHISQSRSSSLLWRWNETDASQFEVGHNTVGEVQVAVSENPWGPSLKIRVNRSVVGSEPGLLVLSMLHSDSALSGLSRYRLKFRVSGFTGNKADWLGLGAAYMYGDQGSGASCLGDILTVGSPGGRIFRLTEGKMTLGSYVSPGGCVDLVPLVGRCQIDVEHELTYRKVGKALGYQSRLSSGAVHSTSDEVRATRELGIITTPVDHTSCVPMGVGIVLVCDKGSTKATFDLDAIRLVPHEMDS